MFKVTFAEIIALNFPFSDKIFFAIFSVKKSFIVGIFFAIAIYATFDDGSTPKTS